MPGAMLTVKLTVVDGGNVFEHMSAPGQSGVAPLLSASTKNLCGAPSPLDSCMVIVSPWVTVIVGFGVPVLFQAAMNPMRVIVLLDA